MWPRFERSYRVTRHKVIQRVRKIDGEEFELLR